LASHPAVTSLIASTIERINRQLTRTDQIRDFRILPRPLDPEADGEPVTPTRKVKRRHMAKRFEHLIAGMDRSKSDRLEKADA
jgi:long-chain acyl-CoA synthetase